MRRDGDISRPIGKSHIQGTREEGWVRKEREKAAVLRV
jgi:hypothetical protein